MRVIAAKPFALQWTANQWVDSHEATASPTRLALWYVDVCPGPSAITVRFKFKYGDDGTWNHRDYVVQIGARAHGQSLNRMWSPPSALA